jgi:hypothetical protein
MAKESAYDAPAGWKVNLRWLLEDKGEGKEGHEAFRDDPDDRTGCFRMSAFVAGLD